jgi:hypothetical protein
MKSKLKEAPRKPAEESKCRHYWVIEDASGPTSRGVCKFCGAEREFYNSWPASSFVGRDTGVLGLPDLLDVESEGGGEDSELEESKARL